MADRASFSIEAMVRGYHAYKDIWTAVHGEELLCQREDGNRVDAFAVAVVKDETVVGHVPKKISSVCSLYLRRGGSIVCRVTGPRRYSEDLVQGGLEIPCVLIFEGGAKHTAKAKKLVESAFAVTAGMALTNTPNLPAQSKKRKLSEDSPEPGEKWVQFATIVLTKTDKDQIIAGEKLDDRHIDVAQGFLKQQFPCISGLQSPLLQKKKLLRTQDSHQHQIQIIHSRGDHWIVASTVLADDGQVKVYDSVYRTLDRETLNIISNIFNGSNAKELVPIHRQTGGRDCGVYAIAISTALAFSHDPSKIRFNQPAMRLHLIRCLELGKFSLFPTV